MKGMKAMVWIVVFSSILDMFMRKDGGLVFEFGFVNIYEEGVKEGILI